MYYNLLCVLMIVDRFILLSCIDAKENFYISKVYNLISNSSCIRKYKLK